MKKSYSRILAALVSLLLILTVGAGATLAYLHTTAGPVTNTFEPGKVPPEIEETMVNNVKEYVRITNTGNVDAFIRVALVVTWQDKDGNVAPVAPVFGEDYTWNMDTTNWFEKGGFYFYKQAVAPVSIDPDAATTDLIVNAKPLKHYKGDSESPYTLHIEVVASTIQADYNGTGAHPATTHWGVAVNGNTISAS